MPLEAGVFTFPGSGWLGLRRPVVRVVVYSLQGVALISSDHELQHRIVQWNMSDVIDLLSD